MAPRRHGARTLSGWYVVGPVGNRRYIIAPANGDTQTLDHDAAVDFIALLWELLEVEPLYRESEPDFEAAPST